MTDNNPVTEYMTFQEVKDYWRVSTNTARKYISDLGIVRHRLGSSQIVRYRREDIERAITARETSVK